MLPSSGRWRKCTSRKASHGKMAELPVFLIWFLRYLSKFSMLNENDIEKLCFVWCRPASGFIVVVVFIWMQLENCFTRFVSNFCSFRKFSVLKNKHLALNSYCSRGHCASTSEKLKQTFLSMNKIWKCCCSTFVGIK